MKIRVLQVLLSLVFIIVFSLVLFAVVDEMSASRWLSYSSIIASYLAFVASFYLFSSVKDRAVYTYPRVFISFLFFLLAFVVGLIFIIINNSTLLLPASTQGIMWGLYAIIYIILVLADMRSMAANKRTAENVFFVKNALLLLEEIRRKEMNIECLKKVNTFYELVKSAPIDTCAQAKILEQDLLQHIEIIKRKISTQELLEADVEHAIEVLAQRNRAVQLARY